MATYKISALGLFLIVLGVLIISMLICNCFQTSYSRKEGMVSYKYGTQPLTNVYIPEYSGPETGKNGKNVFLVYDNLYFDTDNGNIIEVDSTPYVAGNTIVGNNDTTNIINRLHIANSFKTFKTQRNSFDIGIPNTYEMASGSPPINDSQNTFQNSYTEYIYLTICENTNVYSVIVFPWKDSTYMHILDLGKREDMINGGIQFKNIATVWFGPNQKSAIQYHSNSIIELDVNTSSIENRSKNRGPWINTYGIVEGYDAGKMVYILSDDVSYDDKNGLLIITEIEDGNPKVNIFNQNGEQIQEKDVSTQNLVNTPFKSWIKYNNIRDTMVVYITNGNNRIITVVTTNDFMNVQRFTSSGVDSGPTDGQPGSSNFIPSESKNTPDYNKNDNQNNSRQPRSNNSNYNTHAPPKNASPDMMNDYYQWFYYWATQGQNKNPNSPNFNYSDDYIMKTQIVPPVCPSCPSCPSIGACTNCGGQGGSGTQTMNGNSIVNGHIILDDDSNYNYSGKGTTISKSENTIGGVLNNVVNQPANIISDIGNTTERGVTGAVDLGKDTVSGTVGIGREIVGGTVGIGREIVGGTVGLGKEIVGGIMNLGQGPAQIQGQGQGQGQDPSSAYSNAYGGPAANQLLPQNKASNIDHSNLYGAMPSKGKPNYMPLGSDFSKFGR